jgi:hypothetical protein
MKSPMTPRERFRAVMNFQPFDRLPVIEWASWWDKTIERWHGEGLPAGAADRYEIFRHFGLEMYRQDWFTIWRWSDETPRPAHHGAGVMATADDYERLKKHLYPWPAVDKKRWGEWAEEQRRGDAVLWFSLEGFFWGPRTLFGIEPHLYAFYDQPELMHRINADLADYAIRIIDDLCTVCRPDFMTFAEDLSYNHGPMLSQELFAEFLKPYYQRVIPRLKENDILPIVDSDGDITVPAAWFRDAGIEGILPLERQAGVDIGKLQAQYPRLRWLGGYDKMVMTQGEAAMRAEFERLLPFAKKGGLIIGVDHQTPPGVSYRDYQIFLRLFREYAARAGDR